MKIQSGDKTLFLRIFLFIYFIALSMLCFLYIYTLLHVYVLSSKGRCRWVTSTQIIITKPVSILPTDAKHNYLILPSSKIK